MPACHYLIYAIKISISPETTLRQTATTPALHQYMSHKCKWSNSTIEYIDWHIHGKSLQSMNLNQQKTITKLIHKWLPANEHPGRGHSPTNQQCLTCWVREKRKPNSIFSNAPPRQTTGKTFSPRPSPLTPQTITQYTNGSTNYTSGHSLKVAQQTQPPTITNTLQHSASLYPNRLQLVAGTKE
jgi:hypothetical protein